MRDLWGNFLAKRRSYLVFHDESIPSKRWLLIGLSFVRRADIGRVRDELRAAREAEAYFGEIHFSALPKAFPGPYGAKARVARRWIQSFENGLADMVQFSCLAVDRHSPAYEGARFAHDFHAYNRFTAMALKAGIAWHIGKQDLDGIDIEFVSDAKDRATRPGRGMVDNFEDYLPYRASLDGYLARGRQLDVNLRVRLVDSASDDLLQFTDLLLGATQMALVAGASRAVKRALGGFIVRWCRDVRRNPAEQRLGLHRKFSLWAFPDESGRPYASVPLALDVDDGQMALF